MGVQVEFFPGAPEDFRGGALHDLSPGEWTDDSALALALAGSPVESGGFDPVDQLGRYLCWYREGRRF